MICFWNEYFPQVIFNLQISVSHLSGLAFKTQYCNLLIYVLSLQSSWDRCACWVFFPLSFWIILFFYLLSMKTYKRHQKKKKMKSLVNQTWSHTSQIFISLPLQPFVIFLCSAHVSGTVLIQTTFFKQLCLQSFLSTHFFVHCIGQDLWIYNMTWVVSAIGMGKASIVFLMLLESLCGSSLTGQAFYHVPRPIQCLVLIPVNDSSCEHCSFPVS